MKYTYTTHSLIAQYPLEVSFRGVTGGWAGLEIAQQVFGRIECAAKLQRSTALLLANPVLGSQLRQGTDGLNQPSRKT